MSNTQSKDEKNGRMAQEDALAIAQNGGVSSSDEGDLDGDADDLDDDMMDKISSSPSIEDGGCRPLPAPMVWPRRVSSLPTSLRSSTPSLLELSSRPPTPYSDALEYFPSQSTSSQPQIPSLATLTPARNHHHLHREYATCDDDTEDEFDESSNDADRDTDTQIGVGGGKDEAQSRSEGG